MYFQQCCAIQINQWLIRLHKMIMLLLLISSGILETFKKKQSVLKISTKPMTISLFPNEVALTIFNKNDHHHFQKASHSACVLILPMLCLSSCHPLNQQVLTPRLGSES